MSGRSEWTHACCASCWTGRGHAAIPHHQLEPVEVTGPWLFGDAPTWCVLGGIFFAREDAEYVAARLNRVAALRRPAPARCCFCSAVTTGGIYVRDDPHTTRCGGKHDEEP